MEFETIPKGLIDLVRRYGKNVAREDVELPSIGEALLIDSKALRGVIPSEEWLAFRGLALQALDLDEKARLFVEGEEKAMIN